jgi:choline kinase
MKTVILAAGEGRRLHPLTKDRPKAMLEVGGRMLIERALSALRGAGIERSEVIILSGHKVEKLKEAAPDCRFIHNEIYDRTNNIYSLWLAGGELAGQEFLLLNSDVLFASQMVKNILQDARSSLMMVDDVNPLVKEEMRVMVNAKQRITAIAKTLDRKQSAGEYIGVARFGKDFSKAFFDKMDEMIKAGETGVWYENAIAEILDEHPLYALSTKGLPWIEVDTFEDLARAEEVARAIESQEA